MLKRLAIIGAIIVVAGAAGGYAFIHFSYLAASANIHDYRHHYFNEDGVPTDGSVKVTYLGTTTLLLDDGETQLLVDGFFTRPGVWTIGRSSMSTDTALVDSNIARLKMDRVKAVFVAHSHIDHAFDVPYVIKKTGATLYGSASTLHIGRGGGLREEQMVLYEPGKELKFGQFEVTILASKHSPGVAGVNDTMTGEILEPVVQPARLSAYKEGGSYDMLIKRGANSILVKSSAHYVPGALDNVRANTLFLGILTLGKNDLAFRNAFYDETVGKVKPKLVIPIHWDNSHLPLSENLEAANKTLDSLNVGLDFIIARTKADAISFRILQGYQSIVLNPPPQ